MRKPVEIKEFEDGYKPRGKVVSFAAEPIVLRFPPTAYRHVDPDELKEWQREVSDRLGLNFDIGGGGGGTVSFCTRGETGAAYRCDSDVAAAPDVLASQETAIKLEGSGRLRPWDATPVVLNFPPVAYEILTEPDQLKEWTHDLRQRFGMNLELTGASTGTVSFCQRGGTGAGYRCDSDVA